MLKDIKYNILLDVITLKNNLLNIKINENFINEKDLLFKYGFEGIPLNITKINGKVYKKVFDKNIDDIKTRNYTLGYLYNSLGGFSDKDLFDENVQTSNLCHQFIIVHSDFLISSKGVYGDGLLVYLNTISLKTSPDSKIFVKFRNALSNDMKSSIDNHLVYESPNLNLEQANKYLKFGIHEYLDKMTNVDSKILPGEFLWGLDPNTFDIKIQIESSSYVYRKNFIPDGLDENLYKNFFNMIDYSFIPYKESYINQLTAMEEYKDRFVVLERCSKFQVANALKEGPIVCWNSQNGNIDIYLEDRSSRLHNIWSCYLMAVPLSKQYIVVDFLDRYYSDRKALIKWLVKLQYLKVSKDYLENLSPATLRILNSANFYANKLSTRKNFGNIPPTFDECITHCTHGLILKEQSINLYHLIQDMHKWYQYQTHFNITSNEPIQELVTPPKKYSSCILPLEQIVPKNTTNQIKKYKTHNRYRHKKHNKFKINKSENLNNAINNKIGHFKKPKKITLDLLDLSEVDTLF